MSNRGNSVPGNRAAAGTNPQGGGGISTVQGMGIPSEELSSVKPLYNPREEGELTSLEGTSASPVARMRGEPMGVAAKAPPPAISKPYGFNVETFKNQALGQYGIMKNNLFLVTLYFSNKVGTSDRKFNPSQKDIGLIPLFCSQCMLPSRTLGTQDIVSRYGYDVLEKMPGYQEFKDIQLTFISDGGGEVIGFFDRWVNFIVNADETSGMYLPNNKSGAMPYQVSYKDDYSAIMEIIVYNETMGRIVVYELSEVFPKSIYNVPLSWRFTGEVATLDTLMTYRQFKVKTFKPDEEIGTGDARGLNLFQKIIKGATLAQTVMSVVKKPQSITDVANLAGTAGLVARNFNFKY